MSVAEIKECCLKLLIITLGIMGCAVIASVTLCGIMLLINITTGGGL